MNLYKSIDKINISSFSFYNGWYEILVSTEFFANQKIIKLYTNRPWFDELDLSSTEGEHVASA